MSKKLAWHRFGLRFLCIACGRCCIGSGLVYLYPEDLHAIATAHGIGLQQAAERFCAKAKVTFDDGEWLEYLVLRKDADRCIFLDEQGKLCTIHEHKPYQCRQSPFMPEFLLVEESFEQFAQICPGLGIGKLYPPEQINTQLALNQEREEQYLSDLAQSSLDELFGIDTSNLPTYHATGEQV